MNKTPLLPVFTQPNSRAMPPPLINRLKIAHGVDYLKERAAKADLAEFERLLAMVPKVEAEAHDRLPEGYIAK
jgi:hypothetical protein